MDRIWVAGALAFGLATMVMLTAIAMWLGNVLAVKVMIGCFVSAYVVQVCQAQMALNDDARWLMSVGIAAWAASVLFGAWAIVLMVLS